LTPADWALGQRRFAAQFEPLADDAPGPITLAAWLQLDAKGRKGKTPFVETQEERYAVSPALSDMSAQCLANWQTLQELAGLVTPFTEQVEQENPRKDTGRNRQQDPQPPATAGSAEAGLRR